MIQYMVKLLVKKKCDGTNFMTTRFPFCDKEGCAEGYYNLNGICTNCSMGSENCKKCTYEVNEQMENLFATNVKVMNIC